MAKNKLFLHLGASAHLQPDWLNEHHDLLSQADLHCPQIDQRQMRNAVTEMLHPRDDGRPRTEIEGTWAGITRHWWRGHRDLAISIPEFALADREQAALILDHLAGLRVHLIISLFTDEHDDLLIARWSRLIKLERTHLVELDRDASAVDLAESIAGVAHVVRHERERRRHPSAVRWQRLRNAMHRRPA